VSGLRDMTPEDAERHNARVREGRRGGGVGASKATPSLAGEALVKGGLVDNLTISENKGKDVELGRVEAGLSGLNSPSDISISRPDLNSANVAVLHSDEVATTGRGQGAEGRTTSAQQIGGDEEFANRPGGRAAVGDTGIALSPYIGIVDFRALLRTEAGAPPHQSVIKGKAANVAVRRHKNRIAQSGSNKQSDSAQAEAVRCAFVREKEWPGHTCVLSRRRCRNRTSDPSGKCWRHK
jgi:hypothetical protein